jgi:hypothetical protein
MADQLTVIITGKDGVSRVFAEVTKSASSMADALDKAGTTGAKGLDSVGKGAERAGKDLEGAGRSLNTFQQETESAAQNLDNLAASFDFLTQAALEQERLTQGISAAYGDAGQSMIDFSDAIQDTTRFSNDAAQASLLLANSLVNNYQLGADQVQNLLSVSADLAQMYGMELPDAMSRVAGAIRGEGEAAELLGLNMSDAAVAAAAAKAGLEGWNTGAISEAEKAAFRYNLVMEQAAYATGTAEQAASGANGTIARIGNTFQDVTQDVTSALGPTTAIAGALANVSSQAFSVIGGGAAIAGMFEKVGSSALVARAGTMALSFVLNPIGAVVLGIGAAAAVVGGIWLNHRNDVKAAEEAYQNLVGAIDQTDDVVRNLNLEGKFELAAAIKKELDEARSELDRFAVDMGEVDWFTGVMDKLNPELDSGQLAGLFTDFIGKAYGEAVVNFANESGIKNELGYTLADVISQIELPPGTEAVLADKFISADEFRMLVEHATVEQLQLLAPILHQAAADFFDSMELDTATRAAIETSWEPLWDLMTNPEFDSSKIQKAIDDLIAQVLAGTLAPEKLAGEFDKLFHNITVGGDTFYQVADSIEYVSTAMVANTRTMEEMKGKWESLLATIADVSLTDPQAAEDIRRLGFAFDDLYKTYDEMVYMLDETSGRFQYMLVEGISPTAEQVMQLDAIWASLNATIASGDFDNAVLLSQIMAIINNPDPNVGLDEKIDQLYQLNQYYALMAEVIPAAEAAQAKFLGTTLDILGVQSDLGDEVEQNASFFGDFTGAVDSAAASTADAAKEAQAAAEAAEELRQQWHEAGLALAGYDDIVSQLNLTGNGTGATELAEDIGTATTALDTMFRVIVQNTDAIGQSTQAVADWAAGFLDASDGLSEINRLLDEKIINDQEHADAVAAFNAIAEDNVRVKESILEIQAKQAPVLAELTDAQADYMEQLADLPAEQQAIALGWMDANTAAQANQAISMAAAAANGELGASGKEAFAAYLQGAIALNPMLKTILEDIGLLNSDGTINFGVAESTMSDIDRLTLAITGLVDVFDDGELNGSFSIDVEGKDEVDDAVYTINSADGTNATSTYTIDVQTTINGALANQGGTLADLAKSLIPADGDGTAGAISIPIEAEDNATPAIEAVQQLAADTDGTEAEILIEGDNSPALDAIDEAANEHQALDGERVTLFIMGDGSDAMQEFTDVARRHSSLDGDSSTMFVEGDASDAFAAINAISDYDGVTLATSYYNVVTRYSSVGSPGGGGGAYQRHGGIPGYAHGGMIPVELAEAGMELLHFANGGVAPVFDRGVYGVPGGAYVEPYPSSRDTMAGMGGPPEIHVHINAPVYGIDDLTNKVFEGIVASTRVANREQLLGQGVVS